MLSLNNRLIKVCGIAHPETIAGIGAVHPDMCGLIFYDRSPRFAGHLSPGQFRQIPGSILKTGVFVKADLDYLWEMVALYGLKAIQLHGHEDPDYCSTCYEKCRQQGIRLLKVFSLKEAADFKGMEAYIPFSDYFLFDTQTSGYGGSGKAFDWQLLENYFLPHPFFLSGGIGPGDVEALQRLFHPALAGFDINSRFELAPGHKDLQKVEDFLVAIRGKEGN
jgi:phosphoribosylanthranilate isomerase